MFCVHKNTYLLRNLTYEIDIFDVKNFLMRIIMIFCIEMTKNDCFWRPSSLNFLNNNLWHYGMSYIVIFFILWYFFILPKFTKSNECITTKCYTDYNTIIHYTLFFIFNLISFEKNLGTLEEIQGNNPDSGNSASVVGS